MQILIRNQSLDGSWPAEYFCIDPTLEGIPYCGSSIALTTAFCLEVLSLYEQCSKQKDPASAVCDEVTLDVCDRISNAPYLLQPGLNEIFATVLKLIKEYRF